MKFCLISARKKNRTCPAGSTWMAALLLIFVSMVPTHYLSAQNTLDRAGLTASTPAAVAYSFRKLSSSYSGYAVKVRRSSDNNTLDIGFTAGGELDTSSLKTFVGSADGYVATWYDQSGNGNDMTQATNAQQPVLVAAGVVNRANGRPIVRFYGVISGYPNSLNLTTGLTTVGHVAAVIRFAAGGTGFFLSSFGAYNWHGNAPNYLINSSIASASVLGGSAWQDGTATTPASIPWPTSTTLIEMAPATPSTGTAWNNLGNDRNCCHHLSDGSGYCELISFNAALSTTDRQALETNQLNYFITGAAAPVTWLSFAAEKADNGARIYWQTASEQNTADFTVQRSGNGSSWTDIGTVSAAGNSNRVRQYQFFDQAVLHGTQFYRILQRDLDGKSSYSDIRRVDFDSPNSSFKLLSNLALNGELRIALNKPLLLSLYNSIGMLVWKKQFGAGIQSIDLRNAAKGVYYLQAEGQTKKIVLP